jgi:hypothetical protein
MHRYGIRILVAVLTFALGVGLSMVFGLVRFPETNIAQMLRNPSSCGRKVRMARPPLLAVDSQPHEPLKLVYLGAVPAPHDVRELRMELRVENRSEQTVAGYSISSQKIWKADGTAGGRTLEWDSNVLLRPGESRVITVTRDAGHALSLRVEKVTFEDGSIWSNPRVAR